MDRARTFPQYDRPDHNPAATSLMQVPQGSHSINRPSRSGSSASRPRSRSRASSRNSSSESSRVSRAASSVGPFGPSRGRSPSTSDRYQQAREWIIKAGEDPADRQWQRAWDWLHSTFQDPWNPCFLTLDGGGIRGYSSALILQELMNKIHAEEIRQESENPTGYVVPAAANLLPCHYFDYMFGTSTGGLIALMLGRLRMSIQECLQQYRVVGDRLFGQFKNIIPFMSTYRCEPLENAIKELVEEKGLGRSHVWKLDTEPWAARENYICQSCCLSTVPKHSNEDKCAYLLRSYDYSPDQGRSWRGRAGYNSGADELDIWEVARATSAAPMYFDMLEKEVDGQMRRYKDGGMCENNPSFAAFLEYAAMFAGDDENAVPTVMLSIGTGRVLNAPDGFLHARSKWWARLCWFKPIRMILENFAILPDVLGQYASSQKTHQLMLSSASGEATWYKRLNVSEGLEDMRLDNWEHGTYQGHVVPGGTSLTRMHTATVEYLRRPMDDRYEGFAAPHQLLSHVAEKVVRVRRARQQLGGPRWEQFIDTEGLRARMASQHATPAPPTRRHPFQFLWTGWGRRAAGVSRIYTPSRDRNGDVDRHDSRVAL